MNQNTFMNSSQSLSISKLYIKLKKQNRVMNYKLVIHRYTEIFDEQDKYVYWTEFATEKNIT